MTLYAVTIFLSAFLLFQVQPLIAKMILPWFGGSAAVWSASMLFFQLLLLAGYAYAHVSIRFLKPRMQMLVHVALLLGSCALLPILPNPIWRPTHSRRSHGSHSAATDRDDRAAVFPALFHQPALASVVRAPHWIGSTLPAVRAVELRIDAGAGELSVSGGADLSHSPAGVLVERWLRRVCANVRLHGVG